MSTCVRVACTLCFAVMLSACARDDEPVVRAIRATRVLDADQAPRWDAGVAERFGFPDGASRRAASVASGVAPSDTARRAPVAFELPDGWRELPSTAMRALNFAVGDGGECYLTSLPGSAGGLLANVNRWRGQMGHAPLTLAEVEALPRRSLLGADAWLVDLRGGYTGMDGVALDGERRLLGLAHVSSAGSLFLKAVGPAEVWEREADAFFALAASLRPHSASHDHAVGDGHAAHGDAAHDHAAHGDASDPQAGAPRAPEHAALTGAGALRWRLPDAWTPVAPSSMALAGFVARAAPDVRVSVSLLPGLAGGVRANLDRWAGQLGSPPLDDAAFASLPRVPLLDGDAPLFERAGRFAGMGAEPLDDALLLGVAQPVGAQTLFVKLVGPRAAALAERDAFLAFCASLRSAADD